VTSGATRAVIERYLAALNAHDANAAADCVAADFSNEHTSALGTNVHGRDAYRGRLPEFLARFQDLHYEVEDWIVADDRAAVPYRMTCAVVDGGATHRVMIRGVFRFRVANGEIVHRVDYWDGNEFARQTTGASETERTS
jgi:limonene-1,2-epoxide hydrolase